MRNKLFLIFGILLFGIVFVSSAFYVDDPTKCPSTDSVTYPGQDCSPNDICGDISGIAQCADTSLINPPGTTATSNTAYNSSLNGGYVVDCYRTTTCNFGYCNRNSTCYTTKLRDTTCTANQWVASTCGNCRTGYLDCSGNDICETQIGVTAYTQPHSTYLTCTSGQCASGYVNCTNNLESGGCNEQIGVSACTTGDGSPGTYNSTCGCSQLSQQNFSTNTLATGYGSYLLWGNQTNSAGWLVNLFNLNSWFHVDNNANVNTSGNLTATYYFGSGKYLTDLSSLNEADPFWSDNFTKYNSSWSSTYNSTYNTWAYNQTTPAVNTILGFNYYNSTTLSLAETDPKWSGNITNYFTKAEINSFAYYNSSSFSIFDYYLKNNYYNFINSTTFSNLNNVYLNTTNQFNYYNSTTWNNPYGYLNYTINSSYYVDNIHNYWNSTFATFNKTYADTLYATIGNPYSYFNSTSFGNYNKAYLNSSNQFSYLNSTSFSNYANVYLNTSNQFAYFNSTTIPSYATGIQLSGNITGFYMNTTNQFGYYNSTTFSNINNIYLNTTNQFGYYNSTNWNSPYSYWNSTFATFNKTYADTLYAGVTEPKAYNGTLAYNSSLSSYYGIGNAYSYYNSTTIPSYLLSESDPLWTSNQSSYYLKSNPFSFYNSTTLPGSSETLWSANYSQLNNSWSSTYNSTYNTWAYNQTTPAVNTILGFNYYNSTTLPSSSETLWSVNYSQLNNSWSSINNATYNTGYLFATNGTYYKKITNDFGYWNSTFATFNKTYADTLYAALGSTGITGAQLAGNLTNFYLNTTNQFSYYNSTTIPSYISWANAMNGTLMLASNWNATNTSYYLATNPYSFYNSTTFSLTNIFDQSLNTTDSVKFSGINATGNGADQFLFNIQNSVHGMRINQISALTGNHLSFTTPETGTGLTQGFDIGIESSNGLTAQLMQRENAPLEFYTNADHRMIIMNSTGYVGINTQNPQNMLNVIGDINATGNLYGNNTFGYYNSTTLPASTETLWSVNYSQLNNSWSSTYNSTYNAYNSTGLIINWSTSATSNFVATGSPFYNTYAGVYTGTGDIGYNNVILGATAGQQNTGNSSTFVGNTAGYQNTGTAVTAIGIVAGEFNTGENLVAVGNGAGDTNNGSNVVAIGGYDTGYLNTGNNSVFIGYHAGYNNNINNQFILEQEPANSIPLIQGDFGTLQINFSGDVFSQGKNLTYLYNNPFSFYNSTNLQNVEVTGYLNATSSLVSNGEILAWSTLRFMNNTAGNIQTIYTSGYANGLNIDANGVYINTNSKKNVTIGGTGSLIQINGNTGVTGQLNSTKDIFSQGSNLTAEPKAYNGSLRLTNNNTYNGPSTVNGNLTVAGAGSGFYVRYQPTLPACGPAYNWSLMANQTGLFICGPTSWRKAFV